MSFEEENDYWSGSDVRPFNFDDDDQIGDTNPNPTPVKTLESILAAKPSSNEPFLRPSMIMCHDDNTEQLLDYLDSKSKPHSSETPKLDPRTYIVDIVDGKKPIDFSIYKSKREKLMLLDCAISCLDGNIITAVTIFMSKTLKPSLFVEELRRRPMAVDHYINYLDITGRQREVIELNKKLLIQIK